MTVTDEQVIEFYNSAAWKRTRKLKLANDPLCETCKLSELVIAATQVHHSLPIRKFWEKRFNQEFLFSLCDSCHSKIENEIEQTGGRKIEKNMQISRM